MPDNELIRQIEYRGKVGTPNPLETESYLKSIFPIFKRESLKLTQNENSIRSFLTQLKGALTGSRSGKAPSRLSLVAHALADNPYKQFYEMSRVAYLSRDPSLFSFFYDVAAGIIYDSTMISLAEEELRGETDSSYDDSLSRLEKAGLPQKAEDSAAQYLRIKESSRLAIQLLIEDPTGFALVDYIAQTEDLPLKLDKITCQKYVKAGKELAGEMFKIYYPLTSHLYS